MLYGVYFVHLIKSPKSICTFYSFAASDFGSAFSFIIVTRKGASSKPEPFLISYSIVFNDTSKYNLTFSLYKSSGSSAKLRVTKTFVSSYAGTLTMLISVSSEILLIIRVGFSPRLHRKVGKTPVYQRFPLHINV